MDIHDLFTIGHSTHSAELFIELLAQYEIKALVDIRRFPGSRKHPQFNREALASSLPAAGIEYHWLESLGGRRGREKGSDSPNLGLRNESFRNYADYMSTAEFRAGMNALAEIAAAKRTALMCAESLFWRCHRRLVSDYVLAHGGTVWHIFPSGELKPHVLTDGAQVEKGTLTYPGPATLFD